MDTRYPSTTPTVLSRLPEESLRITLSLPNYQTVNEVVRMPEGGQTH